MQRLTKQQSQEWLANNGFEMEEQGHHFWKSPGSGYAIDFSQPETSRGLAVISALMAGACTMPALLFITEWGVWPTEEMPALFSRIMSGYGDPRPLHEAPGLLLDESEQADLRELIRFTLISGWSGGVLSARSPLGFAVTDDDWVGVFGGSKTAVTTWLDAARAKDLNIRVLWEGPTPEG